MVVNDHFIHCLALLHLISVVNLITPLSKFIGDDSGSHGGRQNMVLFGQLAQEIPVFLAERSERVDTRQVEGVIHGDSAELQTKEEHDQCGDHAAKE